MFGISIKIWTYSHTSTSLSIEMKAGASSDCMLGRISVNLSSHPVAVKIYQFDMAQMIELDKNLGLHWSLLVLFSRDHECTACVSQHTSRIVVDAVIWADRPRDKLSPTTFTPLLWLANLKPPNVLVHPHNCARYDFTGSNGPSVTAPVQQLSGSMLDDRLFHTIHNCKCTLDMHPSKSQQSSERPTVRGVDIDPRNGFGGVLHDRRDALWEVFPQTRC